MGQSLSPDGDSVASPWNANDIGIWNAQSGKLLRSIPIQQLSRASDIAFSPDMQLFAVERWGGKIAIYNLVSNERLANFSIKPDQTSAANSVGSFLTSRLQFSFDKRFFAVVSSDGLIYLWDIPAGKLIKKISFHQNAAVCLAFSHDNRLLVSCTGTDLYKDDPNKLRKHDLVVWDMRSLQPLVVYRHLMGKVHAIAFSPGDRALAIVTDDGSIRLIETCSCKELLRYHAKDPFPRSVAFSPSGREIATAMTNGTIFLWSLIPPDLHIPVNRLSALELDHYWERLAMEDSHKAYLSICILSNHPSDVIPFLREHLRPIRRVDAQVIEKFIVELDSDVFSRREEAVRELSRLGRQAESALRGALAKSPSAESLRRIHFVTVHWFESRDGVGRPAR
jgi:dipeptidyl aminopeptidase/acylaminoacyl peptidase